MFAVRILIDLPFARRTSLSRPANLDLELVAKPSLNIPLFIFFLKQEPRHID